MDMNAPAGALMPRRPDPPPWSENGAWLLWGVLSCGLLVAVGFFQIGARYRRQGWQWCGVFYALVVAALIVVVATIPRDADGELVTDAGWQNVVGPVLLCVLLAGVLHSIIIHVAQPRRPPVVQPVQPAVRYPGAVSGPWLAASAGYYARRALWPSRYVDVVPPARADYAAAAPAVPGWSPPPRVGPRPVAAVDSPAVVEPWASFVRSAERSCARFHAAAARVPAGPLRGTVDELAGRIDASVDECRRIASAGRVLAEARAGIETAVVDRAFTEAEERRAADPADPVASSTLAALQSQRAAAARLDEVIDDALDRVRLLDARLGEAVARMLELSARAEASVSAPELSSDLDNLLTDLEALRLAVEETHALDVIRVPPGPWDQAV